MIYFCLHYTYIHYFDVSFPEIELKRIRIYVGKYFFKRLSGHKLILKGKLLEKLPKKLRHKDQNHTNS